MSESVACALQYINSDQSDWQVGPLVAKLKRKDDIAPYMSKSDERFKVRMDTCLHNLMLIIYILSI